jgi:hypothetical protein
MFDNVIAEKSNNIFTRTNKLFPVRGRIVVKSPDTDVLVKNTSELWFQTGLITSTKHCRRYIPVHDLCNSLSSVVCEILPADHDFILCTLGNKGKLSQNLLGNATEPIPTRRPVI